MTRCTCKPGDECENCFTANILELAALQDWRAFRFPTWRATCTAPGVPDLWLVRPPELLVIEAKRDGKTLTPAQTKWLDALSHVTEVNTFCFSPRHWPLVVEALSRESGEAKKMIEAALRREMKAVGAWMGTHCARIMQGQICNGVIVADFDGKGICKRCGWRPKFA